MKKRAFSVISAVAAICALAAISPAGMTYSIAPTGTYTVSASGNTTTIVDMYKVTFDAGAGHVIGAVSFVIGNADVIPAEAWIYPEEGDPYVDPNKVMQGAHMGADPFQVWKDDATMTATFTDGNGLSTTGNLRQADTHLLKWAMTGQVVTPCENNDFSLVIDPVNGMAAKPFGRGSLAVITGIALASRAQVMDVIQVGVVRGDAPVRITGSVADESTEWQISYLLIPEPATMSLLALGAVGLIRRRRA